jgi:tetratricopeptide (TPR) repeat protein
LLVVGLLALALRLLHLFQISQSPFFYHPIVDAWDYDVEAWKIALTRDWTGPRVFFQAPLTTYVLAAIYRVVGHDLFVPRLLQVLLGTFTSMGALVLARRIFGHRAAWIAGIAVACYSMLIFFEGELLAPSMTVALDVAMLLVLFTVVAERPGWPWVVPGLLFGLRALATTNNLVTVPVFWAWIYFQGRHLRWSRNRIVFTAVAFAIGIGAAVAPATLHNWAFGQHFVPVSSNAGINFYLGNSGDYEARVGIRPGADWDEFVRSHVREGLKVGPEMSGHFFRQAWGYIRSHPAEYVRLLFYKAGLFLGGREILRNQDIYAFRTYSAVLRLLLWKLHIPGGPGLAFPFGLLLPLAWPGCLLVLRKRHRDGGLVLGFAVVYSLSVIAFFITSRYRMPVVVPLVLLAAYGWSNVRGWWKSARWRWAALVGMVALVLFSNWNQGPMSEEMNPDAYYSLATTLANQSDIDGAEKYYRKALEMNPQDASAWVNLGLNVYERRGMLERAGHCYARALAVRPGYAIAVYNTARLAEIAGRPADAESLYYEAARLDPLMSGPYTNLGTMALNRGEYGRALSLYTKAYERDPENPNIYYNLAVLHARANRPGQAAYAARKAFNLNPWDNEAYILYAEQMRLSGGVEEARRYLERAVKRYPKLTGPKEALLRLR